VEVARGDAVESVHRGSALVASAAGEILFAVGDPDQFIYLRSSAKPFQLAPFVASGRFDEYGMGTEALAVMSASHGGEDRHVRTVQSILRTGGVNSSVLQCGTHPPLDTETANRLIRDGEQPTVLRHNCSGKHSAMVLFAKASGWPMDTYWHPDHPVQRLALETVSALTDVPIESIATATDGCGVVTFGMPLRGLAVAFARLADPAAVVDRPVREALTRIRDAMLEHPELVAGTRRLDTLLMRAYPGRVVSKGGAEGVLAMGVLPGAAGMGSGAMGFAAKIEDGLGRRAAGVVAVESLRQIGLGEPQHTGQLSELAHPKILDPRGEVSGEVRPAFRLTIPR
jgi:L-asparaginase II